MMLKFLLLTFFALAPVPRPTPPTRLTEAYMLGEWKFVGDSDWQGTIVFYPKGDGPQAKCVKTLRWTTRDGQKAEKTEEGWWEVYDDDTLQIHCKGYYLLTFDLTRYPLRGKVRTGRAGNWLEIVMEKR
jgi:hypothetical protein